MSDYPAAHSMDTTWFAIDQCGHVGVFASGEEGAVALGATDVWDVFDDAFRPGELRWVLDRSKEWKWGEHKTKAFDYEVEETDGRKTTVRKVSGLFILAPGLEAWGRERAETHTTTGRTDGHVWLNGSMAFDAWTWLHETPGRCMGCLYGHLLTTEERCRLYGIFEYECPDYGHPPYEREQAPPPLPATLSMLSTLFTITDPPRFPFCFLAKPRIQPKEWLPSRLYGDDWVKEDGTPMVEGPGE